MSLPTHEATLLRRLTRLERDFLTYYSNPNLERQERWYRFEGLLSQTWQSWCYFCRTVTIDSCLGTVASGGRPIAKAKPTWVDSERINYEAKCALWNNPPKPAQRLQSVRKEITWGDVDSLVKVVTTLLPSNSSELLSGFGSGLPGPKHLQIVRNNSAHLNHENAADVRRLTAYYFGSSLHHPCDIAAWAHIGSRDPAYVVWLADMRTIAAASTQ